MVNVYRHELAATVADEQALDLVRRQWAVHQKLIDRNYVNHTEVYGILRRVVGGRGTAVPGARSRPRDAAAVVGALIGTRVAHYRGVDLAKPPLELAKRNLDALGCEVELEQRDFIEAMRDRPEPADVVWSACPCTISRRRTSAR